MKSRITGSAFNQIHKHSLRKFTINDITSELGISQKTIYKQGQFYVFMPPGDKAKMLEVQIREVYDGMIGSKPGGPRGISQRPRRH